MDLPRETTLMEYGKHQNSIKVKQNKQYRSLYFQGDVLQSQMNREFPEQLCISYTQYMILPLLLSSSCSPQKILIIGVGGGSLLRFFSHHFDLASLSGVEYSQQVLDIAEKYFHIREDETTSLHCGCGYDFLQASCEEYDLILVDAFDNKGMAESIYNKSFFELCRKKLTSNGAVVCNTWSNDESSFKKVHSEFKDCFSENCFSPVPMRGNIIFYGFAQNVSLYQLHPRNPFLIKQEQRFGMDFTKMVITARRANIPLWKRIL